MMSENQGLEADQGTKQSPPCELIVSPAIEANEEPRPNPPDQPNQQAQQGQHSHDHQLPQQSHQGPQPQYNQPSGIHPFPLLRPVPLTDTPPLTPPSNLLPTASFTSQAPVPNATQANPSSSPGTVPQGPAQTAVPLGTARSTLPGSIPIAPPVNLPTAPPGSFQTAPPGTYSIAPPGSFTAAPRENLPPVPLGQPTFAPPRNCATTPTESFPTAHIGQPPFAPPESLPTASSGLPSFAHQGNFPAVPPGNPPFAPPGTFPTAPRGNLPTAPPGKPPFAPPGGLPSVPPTSSQYGNTSINGNPSANPAAYRASNMASSNNFFCPLPHMMQPQQPGTWFYYPSAAPAPAPAPVLTTNTNRSPWFSGTSHYLTNPPAQAPQVYITEPAYVLPQLAYYPSAPQASVMAPANQQYFFPYGCSTCGPSPAPAGFYYYNM
ncbi:hypothetical protein F5Y19DRAFT_415198 [Xylariaceae sp. FL1651]|nr:hypothetical protein F5Y19DRAFT_415198 [Xylariaceae sp. FL1651]